MEKRDRSRGIMQKLQTQNLHIQNSYYKDKKPIEQFKGIFSNIIDNNSKMVTPTLGEPYNELEKGVTVSENFHTPMDIVKEYVTLQVHLQRNCRILHHILILSKRACYAPSTSSTLGEMPQMAKFLKSLYVGKLQNQLSDIFANHSSQNSTGGKMRELGEKFHRWNNSP